MSYRKKVVALLLRQMRANSGRIEVQIGSRADHVLSKMPQAIRGNTLRGGGVIRVEYLLKPDDESQAEAQP